MEYIKLSWSFILKIFTFKKGSLFLTSSVASTGFTYYANLLVHGVDKRDMLIALVVELAFLTFFMIFTTIDLVTGIQAAFYVNKHAENPLPKEEVVQSSKLWRTFWKSFGIVVLTLLLTFLVIFTVLMKSNAAYWVGIWTLVCFWTMVCGFEFYSIGENLAKRNKGQKHRVFKLVDAILNAIQRRVINKIDNAAGIEQDNKNP